MEQVLEKKPAERLPGDYRAYVVVSKDPIKNKKNIQNPAVRSAIYASVSDIKKKADSQKDKIHQAIYERFIEPTKKERTHYIGVEIEIPVLNLQKRAVDFSVIHRVTEQFIRDFSFVPEGRDEEGNIYMAQHPDMGDVISYDCSYNNLEFSMGKEKELFTIKERFETYYSHIKALFEKEGHTLTGMGVNPYRIYNRNEPIPNGRYRMLLRYLKSYRNYDIMKYFHQYPEYGLFSSASQVQLDVEYDRLIQTIRVFSRLEPVKAVLFSNSVLLGEHEELQCCRDYFWENSTHGINPHNVGMYEKLPESISELQAYLETTSMFCVERGDKYINFSPVPVMEYFAAKSITGEYYDRESGGYRSITFVPKLGDLQYLRTYKTEDLTFRGTIEFRSVCCQPMKDSMLVAAFHQGILANLEETDRILAEDQVLYGRGYSEKELRELLNRTELPSFIDEDALYGLAGKVTDLARDGLVKRGYGEEVLLDSLYERIEHRTNPAKELLKRKDELETVIREYGSLN